MADNNNNNNNGISDILESEPVKAENLTTYSAKLQEIIEILSQLQKQKDAIEQSDIASLSRIDREIRLRQQQKIFLQAEFDAKKEINKYENLTIEQLKKEVELKQDSNKQERDKLFLSEKVTEQEILTLETETKLIDELNKIIDKKQKIIDKKKLELTIEEKITGGLATQLKNLFLVEDVLEKIGIYSKAVLDTNREFAEQTGQIRNSWQQIFFAVSGFSTDFFANTNAVGQYGISIEKLNASTIALFKSTADFSNMNSHTQEKLALSATRLSLLGISADATAANLNSLTKAFGMTADQALSANEELARAAIGAGIAPSKMLTEFSSNLPRLAAYGKQAKDVFIDMEKQAKSLGMELNTLNGIVGDQFDTFENSARAAGKFNAVLGGNYLNSVEMLNATESERIILLKQSFEQSGKNFDSLDKYQKKAIAATLGIQDLNEASKLFNTSTSQMTADMQKSAATQEQLAKAEREAANITDQLSAAWNSLLIVARPIIEFFKLLVNWLSVTNDAMGGLLIPAIGIIYAFTKIRDALKGASMIKNFAGWFKSTAVGMKIFGAAAVETGTQTAAAGTAAATGSAGFMSVAISVLTLGAGIALAAGGIALLVFLIKELVTSVTAENVDLLIKMSSGIVTLVAAMTTGVFGIAGIATLSLGIAAIAVALNSIPDSKTLTLKTLNETLNNAKTLREEDIKPTKDFVRVIKDYYEVQAKSKDSDKDALVAALKEIMNPSKEQAASEEATPIKLVISGNDLAYAINNGNSTVSGLMTGPRTFKRRNG